MPPLGSIKKTTPASSNGSPRQGNGILGKIKPVAQRIGCLRMSLYGRSKTGKTRLASTFPKPALIIGSEDGTSSVVGTKGLDFVQLERCSDFQEIVAGVVETERYATVIVDTATKLRDMRISEILGLSRTTMSKGWGFAGRDQWTECANSLKELLRPLFDVARRGNVNVVIVAQEADLKEGSGSSNADLIRPEIGPSLGKSLSDWVNAECDYIGQTIIRQQTVARQVEVIKGEPPETRYEATGVKEYCLRVGPHEVYQAGFRVPIGREIKDDFLVNPTYDKIMKLING